MSDVCAIIAGAGSFPFFVADEAKRQGLTVLGIGLAGWVDASLARHVDHYEEVPIGQLGRLLDRLKAHQASRAIMAGKVTKAVLFDSRMQFDREALGILSHIKGFSVNDVLGAIAARLAKDGITLLDSSTFLKSNLSAVGVLTRRKPSAAEQEDIRVGSQVARQLAGLDVGQTVVVKNKVIIAVEALEGTDATLKRAGELAGPDLVVVKMASPKQDMRFDLPICGPQTIAVAVASGVRCLAVEAHKTLFLDKDVLLAKANEADLCLVGIEPEPQGR